MIRPRCHHQHIEAITDLAKEIYHKNKTAIPPLDLDTCTHIACTAFEFLVVDYEFKNVSGYVEEVKTNDTVPEAKIEEVKKTTSPVDIKITIQII